MLFKIYHCFLKKGRQFDSTRKDVILLSTRFSYTVNWSTQFSLTGPQIWGMEFGSPQTTAN